MKRFLSIIIVAVIMIGIMPVTVFAAPETIEILGHDIPAGTRYLFFKGYTKYIYTAFDYTNSYAIPRDETLDCKLLADNFPELYSLKIVGGKLENTEYLAELKNLVSLELYSVEGTEDISFLENMTTLRKLAYDNDDCNDITPIHSLTKLTYLDLDIAYPSYIGDYRNFDISPLENLTKLRTLYLNIETEDITPLKNMNELQLLHIASERLDEGLEILADFPKLTDLRLYGAEISDPKFISGIKSLKVLDLSNCNYYPYSGITLSEISELPPDLEKLEIHYYNGSCMEWYEKINTEPISKLTKLKSLEITGHALSNCNFLKDMTSLEELKITGCLVSDISELKKLTALSSLDLHDNRITDISALKGLKKLESLNLSTNNISKASSLNGLKNLKYLNISYNEKLKSGDFFKDLTGLEKLYAYSTKITNWSCLENLTSLKTLTLTKTGKVQNEMLDYLNDLTALEYIDVSGNDWETPKEAKEFFKEFHKTYPECELKYN